MEIIRRHYSLSLIGIFILLFLGIQLGLPFVYGLNDDAMMQNIVSGKYLGNVDSHLIYMGYPLSAILACFYRVIPNVPWFGMFLVGISTFSLFLIGTTVVKEISNKAMKVLASILILEIYIIYYLEHYLIITYTEVAALVFGTGLFLFCMNKEEETVKGFITSNSISLILLLLSFMIRDQVFYMFLPYLSVAGLWKMAWAYGKKQEKHRSKGLKIVKKYLSLVVVLMIGVGSCVAIDSGMHQGEDWKAYEAYDITRTDLYDFTGIPTYQNNEEYYWNLDLTENDYMILTQYNILLKDYFTEDVMAALAEKAKENNRGNVLLTHQIKEAVIEYGYRTVNKLDWPMNYIMIGLYLTAIGTILYSKKWLELLTVLMLSLGRNVLWLYFIVEGRYPTRITFSLYLVEALLLVAIILKQYGKGSKTITRYPNLKKMILVTSILLFIPMTFQTTIQVNQKANEKFSKNKEFEALELYCEENSGNFYYVDVYSTVKYSENIFTSPNIYKNYVMLGGWMTETPLLKEKLLASQDKDIFYIAEPNSPAINILELDKIDEIAYNGKELFHVYKEQ